MLSIQPFEFTRMARFDVQQQGSGIVMIYPSSSNQPTLPDRVTNAPAIANTTLFSGKIIRSKSS
jgi:hypothetical protein